MGEDSSSSSSSFVYKFPPNKISFDRLSSLKPLCCRYLSDYHDNETVSSIEFSDDSSLFVSGGGDGRVLLWPTNKAVDEKWTPNPTEMNTKHENSAVYCLAVSPDNKHIFSGGFNKRITIHDAET